MDYAQFEKDADNIVTVTMNDPDKKVNVMNAAFITGIEQIVEKLEQERDNISGVILTSAKNTFFAGGDLEEFLAFDASMSESYYNKVLHIKEQFRRLECLGKPVVAAINGAALGGGYEICLATHHRIALDNRQTTVGMPEVTLGLLPGGGGVVRSVRMLGLKKALPLLMNGNSLSSTKALEAGLIDDLASDREQLMSKAKAWILANLDAEQPWYEKGFKFPGGEVNNPDIANFIVMTTAKLQATKKGLYPAPQEILSVAVEGMQVDFDSANRIESRALTYLAATPVAKNMITSFFQMNKLMSGESRPDGFPKTSYKKIGILGAGMMGAGIAYVAAKVGIEVVLKDVNLQAAEKGKTYSDTICSKLISRGSMAEAQKQTLLELILPTETADDLQGCELIIEAVFEDRNLKATVTQEAQGKLVEDAVFATNTSSLPITGLAEAYRKQENFIGLHFFSPVDRMPLVEIICGKKTSDETLARSYDFVTQIRKIPIVVNDSRDFYTSRVYESYCDEGAWLLADGVPPAMVENGAQQSGMPAGPLASVDAVSQKLVNSVKSMAKSDWETEHGTEYQKANEPPFKFVNRLATEFDRCGKAFGAGYFEYPENGKKYFWPGLADLLPPENNEITVDIVKQRILFRQCIEAVRCLEENVLRSVTDCNIGSMKGIGFPPYTGGQLQYINSYGIQEFTAKANELAEKYGQRFAPPALLLTKAAAGEKFV